ncbi:hypothetical protein BGW36DRAFT_309882, partial [Talaromyces proteolyticus]
RIQEVRRDAPMKKLLLKKSTAVSIAKFVYNTRLLSQFQVTNLYAIETVNPENSIH